MVHRVQVCMDEKQGGIWGFSTKPRLFFPRHPVVSEPKKNDPFCACFCDISVTIARILLG
jgi:hypothetical protein